MVFAIKDKEHAASST